MTLKMHRDFLKSGDPDLTCPWGKAYTTGDPRGAVNLPECDDLRSVRARAVREWVLEIGEKEAGDQP